MLATSIGAVILFLYCPTYFSRGLVGLRFIHDVHWLQYVFRRFLPAQNNLDTANALIVGLKYVDFLHSTDAFWRQSA